MKRKLLAIPLALILILAFAVPVMAANVKIVGKIDNVVLYSEANEWTVSIPSAGTVTVKDNKKDFKFSFDAEGTYSLGLQKIYTGQLKLVGFVPAVSCTHENLLEVVTDPTCTTAGFTTLTCECGFLYIDPVGALGHDYEIKWHDGRIRSVCQREDCGDVEDWGITVTFIHRVSQYESEGEKIVCVFIEHDEFVPGDILRYVYADQDDVKCDKLVDAYWAIGVDVKANFGNWSAVFTTGAFVAELWWDTLVYADVIIYSW